MMKTTENINHEAAQSLADALACQYRQVRVLPDGSVACLQDLLFTRAILLGVNAKSFTRRFCFEIRSLADRRFSELQSADDEPAGWIARRGG